MEDFNSKYTGQQVEDLLDQVASGNAGGGGGITEETDPIFSASPAATITEEKMAEWDKGATAVQPETLAGYASERYVDAEVKALGDSLAEVASSGSYNDLQDKPNIPSAINIAGTNYTPDDSGIIDLNTAYLYRKPSDGIPQEDLSSEVQVALRDATSYKGTVTQVKINGHSLSPNDGEIDLGNIPTSIPTEVYVADFTMESLKTGMSNGDQVDCDMQALITAMNANKIILVREGEDSAYQGGYILNGYAEDLLYFSIVDSQGDVLWCDGTDYRYLQYIDGRTLHLQHWWEKQDALVSGENIKTINGESIVGSGNIEISGGTITEVKANGTSIATSGVADIPAASTSKFGVTKLTTLTNSSSTTLAATASAVKSAYDLADSKASMSDVNTAIANAITNVINASY